MRKIKLETGRVREGMAPFLLRGILGSTRAKILVKILRHVLLGTKKCSSTLDEIINVTTCY